MFSFSEKFEGRVTDSPRTPFTTSGGELSSETEFPGPRRETSRRDRNSQIMLLAVENGVGDVKIVSVLAIHS